MMPQIKKKIIYSLPLWIASALWGVSFLAMVVSFVRLIAEGDLRYIREGVMAGGIYGEGSITLYVALHIATKAVVMILSGITSLGLLVTLISSHVEKVRLPSTFGVTLMSETANFIHKAVIVIGCILGGAFSVKLCLYLIDCYKNRYSNSMVFNFFATIAGEAVMVLIVVGIIYWIYRFSATVADDLAVVQYGLIIGKQSNHAVSVITRYSLIALCVVCGFLAAAFFYDRAAMIALIASSSACLLVSLFLWVFMRFSEILAYNDYVSERKQREGK